MTNPTAGTMPTTDIVIIAQRATLPSHRRSVALVATAITPAGMIMQAPASAPREHVPRDAVARYNPPWRHEEVKKQPGCSPSLDRAPRTAPHHELPH